MKRKNVIKRTMTAALSFVILLSCAINASAAAPEAKEVEEEYLIVNGTKVIHVGEDYDNPDTGEYIHWSDEAIGVMAAKKLTKTLALR